MLDRLIGKEDSGRADTPKQAFLTWLYRSPRVSRLALRILNCLFFVLLKIPGLRFVVPLTSPLKNNISYLPNIETGLNEGIAASMDIMPAETRTIAVDRAVGEVVEQRLSQKVLNDFIDLADIHVVMDHCICRAAFECRQHPHDIGCLFMGETALKLPPGLGRRVTKSAARRHVSKALAAGLVPLSGKVNVDNLGFLTPDTGRLLSVCFCCHCCCMMGYFKHSKSHLKKIFTPVEGLTVEVTDTCVGCGKCVGACIFDAISIRDGQAFHADHCAGCGRCQAVCPNSAVRISLDNRNFNQDVVSRIGAFVAFGAEDKS